MPSDVNEQDLLFQDRRTRLYLSSVWKIISRVRFALPASAQTHWGPVTKGLDGGFGAANLQVSAAGRSRTVFAIESEVSPGLCGWIGVVGSVDGGEPENKWLGNGVT